MKAWLLLLVVLFIPFAAADNPNVEKGEVYYYEVYLDNHSIFEVHSVVVDKVDQHSVSYTYHNDRYPKGETSQGFSAFNFIGGWFMNDDLEIMATNLENSYDVLDAVTNGDWNASHIQHSVNVVGDSYNFIVNHTVTVNGTDISIEKHLYGYQSTGILASKSIRFENLLENTIIHTDWVLEGQGNVSSFDDAPILGYPIVFGLAALRRRYRGSEKIEKNL